MNRMINPTAEYLPQDEMHTQAMLVLNDEASESLAATVEEAFKTGRATWQRDQWHTTYVLIIKDMTSMVALTVSFRDDAFWTTDHFWDL